MTLIGLFIFLSFISGLIALLLGIYVLKHRQSGYQVSLSLLFFSIAWWNLATMFESMSDTLQEHVLWVAITYPVMVLTPVFFFLFIYQYTHISNSIRSWPSYLLFIIPAITCLVVWIPEWRDSIWKDVSLNETPYGTVAHFEHGWWFYVATNYSYALSAIGIFYLMRGLYLFPKRYTLRVRILLISALVPLLANIIYMLKSDYLSGLDLTPIALTIMTTLFYFAISKHKLLQLRPVARDIVIENINEGVIVLDNTNLIVDCNRAATMMLNQLGIYSIDGIAVDECFKENPLFTSFLEDDARERFEMILPDHYYEITKKNILQSSGNLSGKILVFHDFTDNKRKEEEITAINKQLKSANEVKDFLFKVVSHDLKGPIGNISSLTNIMVERSEYAQQETKELKMLHKALANVYYMLENILHWANSQQDELSIKREKNGLLNTINQAWEVIRYQADEKNIQPDIHCEENITAFYDAVTMEIVFRNILSNAIKFSYKDGIIQVVVRADENNATILITDWGIGMSEETIQSTQHNIVTQSQLGTMKEKGTGIGLHMCQNLIRANKGQMDIDSRLNRGTTITIVLSVRMT